MRTTLAIRSNLGPDWTFETYTDHQCVKFIKENPIRGISDKADKNDRKTQPEVMFSWKFRNGAHKGDFCLFWILYTLGGVSLDTDVLLYGANNEQVKNIENVLVRPEYSFVSVEIGLEFETGLIATVARNPAIFETLLDMYTTKASFWTDMDMHYLATCYMLRRNTYGIFLRPLVASCGGLEKKSKSSSNRIIVHYKAGRRYSIPCNFSIALYEIEEHYR